jgi:hypothetical protein
MLIRRSTWNKVVWARRSIDRDVDDKLNER